MTREELRRMLIESQRLLRAHGDSSDPQTQYLLEAVHDSLRELWPELGAHHDDETESGTER